ncbi:MAG: hypothetical protein IPM69_11670 [Ignavibacteria bacterium]|nr:hypothetical protein [Ignavibacteria bacterium]
MNSEEKQEIYQKQHRRQAEYIGLVIFQSVIGFTVNSYLRYDSGCIVMIVAFSIGWVLTRLREERRTLDVTNKSRILTDALESLLLMFILALCAILSLKIGIDLLTIQAHLCVYFVAFFVSSWQSEVHWRKQNLSHLSSKAIRNYILNLNRSIIFPYNSTFLRSLYRK